jgi:hypothetical protein
MKVLLAYLVAVLVLNFLSRRKLWGLVAAVLLGCGLVFIVSWDRKEIFTYSGAWYSVVWSVILGFESCLVWCGSWGLGALVRMGRKDRWRVESRRRDGANQEAEKESDAENGTRNGGRESK